MGSVARKGAVRVTARKPILSLDVDGVISPFGGGPPPGYERTEIRGYQVTWNPRHRRPFEMLAELFELV